jgi:nucleoside-diphosphate-sugar epimerase
MSKLIGEADVIIPLAALVGAPLCELDPVSAEAVNRDAVGFLCRTASRDQQIVLPVTNSGYGIGEKDGMCDENSPLRPVSIYGRTKVEAEEIVLGRENGLGFRFATIFGMSPRMRLDLLVNDFAYRAFRDRAVVIFEGHFRRNFLHIRDAARVFLHALNNFPAMRGRTYNVGLEEANLTKLELCEKIKTHFPQFVFIEAAIGKDPDQRDYLVSNQRILGTGFRTVWDLDRGLAELKRGFEHFPPSSFSNV